MKVSRKLLVAAIGLGLTEMVFAQSCPAGKFSGDGQEPCVVCNIGSYQPLTGQTSCNQASPGFFVSVTGAAQQLACIPGWYQPSSGQSMCLAASPGHFVALPASAFQSTCAPGSYEPDAASTACSLASPGSFVSTSGATTQQTCPVGTFQASPGSTACDPASPGFFVNTTGASQAQACPVGTFQASPGSTACDPASPGFFVNTTGASQAQACPVGTFQASPGSTACDSASPGFFVDTTGASQAQACPAGTFQASPGSTACDSASPGHFVASSASAFQSACAPGSYEPNTASTACSLASPGSFVNTSGATTQQTCPVGAFQASPGSTACDPASPGFFVNTTGASQAQACPVGTFQAAAGQSSCNQAPPGTFVASTASSTATACAAGTYQPSAGASSCLDAGAGFFVPSAGSTTQQACPVGLFQDGVGSTACKQATPGYFVDSTGASAQTPAPVGSFVASAGATAAQACPAGSVSYGASVACRSAPATGANIVAPRFDSEAGRGGVIAHPDTIIVPTMAMLDFNVRNISTDIGGPDPLSRLSLNSLTGSNADGEVGTTGFTPGTTLDEGENIDLPLVLSPGRLGFVTLPLDIHTDEGAGLGMSGQSFHFDFEATADGENVAVAMLADRPELTGGDEFSVWINASNPGLSDAPANDLGLQLPASTICSWEALPDTGANGSGTNLTSTQADSVSLPSRADVLYRGHCSTDISATDPLTIDTDIQADPGINDAFAGDNAASTSLGVVGPVASANADLSLSVLSQTPFLQPNNIESVVYELSNNGPDDAMGGNFAVLVFGAADHIKLVCSDQGIIDCGSLRQVAPLAYAVDAVVNLSAGASVQFTVTLQTRGLRTQHLKVIGVASLPPGSGALDAPRGEAMISVSGRLFGDSFEN